MVEEQPAVRLQPPGAGLPLHELCAARMGMGVARGMMSQEQATAWFRGETGRILSLARSVEPAQAARPVLIRRVPGIEDSSRNWSVYMTLEHLVLVNDWIAEIIDHLVEGETGGRPVSIADVKPGPVSDPEVLERYARSAEAYVTQTAFLPRLHTRMRHAHPWFGRLDAHGWNTLAALHQTIHRRQIEAILRGLQPAR
jgi:hypothetical protein